MADEYEIVYVEKPGDSVWGIIGHAISDYNRQQAGNDHAQILCYAVRTPDQDVVGGVIAMVYWDWLFIDLLWVREDLRGRGYGHRLLTLTEDEARKRGATHAHLDTFSFQAPAFYRQHGYEVFGELQDYPRGHQRYYLQKRL